MHIRRALAALLLATVIPAATAGTVSYLMLHNSTWTATGPEQTRPSRAPATPAPASAPTPAADRSAWPLGTCITTTVQPTDCTTPGALRIVGTIRGPAASCRDIPETDATRRAGPYALCLATH